MVAKVLFTKVTGQFRIYEQFSIQTILYSARYDGASPYISL